MSTIVALLPDDAPCIFAPVAFVRAWAQQRGLPMNLAVVNLFRARWNAPLFVLIGPGASAGL